MRAEAGIRLSTERDDRDRQSTVGINGVDAREQKRDSLYRRLEDGYLKVESGLAQGRDMTKWEDLWIALLREYEGICDDLAEELAA